MTDPEIVEWLQSIASDSGAKYFSVEESEALDAAIARLSATCETCAFGKHVDVFDVIKCVNPASFAFTLRVPISEGCLKHTPRPETR